MPFAYYDRLTRAQQRVYRKSDEVAAIRLPRAGEVRPLAEALAQALVAEDRLAVQRAADRLLVALTVHLGVPPLRTEILPVRPSRSWGELHGLYTSAHGARPATVRLWMRTAQRQQVVKFRTFLRTLIHELCHHLDYELLGLPDSFHTEGFYRRESSLVRQLAGDPWPAGSGSPSISDQGLAGTDR
jgi:hypothetical protein